VVAVKLFRRKRVAVYMLHTVVIGVSKHQTIIQSKNSHFVWPILAAPISEEGHLPDKIIIIIFIIIFSSISRPGG
jgi:hypothetical protein